MTLDRYGRWERIAEIATELIKESGKQLVVITPEMAKAVDDARRAEYYERKEEQEGTSEPTKLRLQS